MSVDKLVDSTQLNSDLTSVANAIRTKSGGSGQLAFPSGFVSEIGNIPSGGGGITVDELALNKAPSGDVVLTTATSLKANCLRNKKEMTSVTGALVTSIESESLRDCSGLESIILPRLTSTLTAYACSNCTSLKLLDVGECTSLLNNSLASCSALDTIILRRTSICTLQSANVLNATKFKSGGAGGTIYIPKALYDHLGDGTSNDYKAATNWSTYEGYGTITWSKIEGSIYE